MKAKKSDADATQKLVDECDDVNKNVASQIEKIGKMLRDIAKTWFDAAHHQEQLNKISEKTIVKIDKIQKVEDNINRIIDEITMSINMVDVEEIEGKDSNMIIQKQIVASSQLLDKVSKLKHQIDDGELDGQSLLNSEIQSTQMSTGKKHQEPNIDKASVNSGDK